MSSNTVLLDAARKLANFSRFDDAEFAYSKILEMAPDDMEALEFVSSRAIGKGQFGRAVKILERASAHAPDAGEIHRALGIAYKLTRQSDAALGAFIRAAKLDPQDYLSRILVGEAFETLGNSYGALTNYFGALAIAQMTGLWLDDETTPPGQRDLVKHATRYINQGRAELLAGCLAPMIARHGREAMRRVAKALSIYLGDEQPAYTDPRQQPLFLYLPELPTHPYFEREQFSWVEGLEVEADKFRGELEAVLSDPEALEPFHGEMHGERLAGHLANDRGAPNWDGYFFYRHGNRYEEHCIECPQTAAAIDKLPLSRIRGHGPEAMFSVLTPGTHILPHRGITNIRLVVHLPLIVPDQCAIVVGGETHIWKENRVMVFDDTFEHEAWNRGDQTRTVLITDIWNPYLDEAEQDALSRLVPAIGDFNRDCGV